MQDSYYNHMLETLLRELKEMITVDDKETMEQYKTMPVPTWENIKGFIDPLNEYVLPNSGKKNALMEYYSKKLFPLLKSYEIKKAGLFKKLVFIKVDDFDFRQIILKLEDLMNA